MLQPGMIINISRESDSRNFLVMRITDDNVTGDITAHILKDDGRRDSIVYPYLRRCLRGDQVRVMSRIKIASGDL